MQTSTVSSLRRRRWRVTGIQSVLTGTLIAASLVVSPTAAAQPPRQPVIGILGATVRASSTGIPVFRDTLRERGWAQQQMKTLGITVPPAVLLQAAEVIP
jgi:hypothetical protein